MALSYRALPGLKATDFDLFAQLSFPPRSGAILASNPHQHRQQLLQRLDGPGLGLSPLWRLDLLREVLVKLTRPSRPRSKYHGARVRYLRVTGEVR